MESCRLFLSGNQFIPWDLATLYGATQQWCNLQNVQNLQNHHFNKTFPQWSKTNKTRPRLNLLEISSSDGPNCHHHTHNNEVFPTVFNRFILLGYTRHVAIPLRIKHLANAIIWRILWVFEFQIIPKHTIYNDSGFNLGRLVDDSSGLRKQDWTIFSYSLVFHVLSYDDCFDYIILAESTNLGNVLYCSWWVWGTGAKIGEVEQERSRKSKEKRRVCLDSLNHLGKWFYYPEYCS